MGGRECGEGALHVDGHPYTKQRTLYQSSLGDVETSTQSNTPGFKVGLTYQLHGWRPDGGALDFTISGLPSEETRTSIKQDGSKNALDGAVDVKSQGPARVGRVQLAYLPPETNPNFAYMKLDFTSSDMKLAWHYDSNGFNDFRMALDSYNGLLSGGFEGRTAGTGIRFQGTQMWADKFSMKATVPSNGLCMFGHPSGAEDFCQRQLDMLLKLRTDYYGSLCAASVGAEFMIVEPDSSRNVISELYHTGPGRPGHPYEEGHAEWFKANLRSRDDLCIDSKLEEWGQKVDNWVTPPYW